MSRESSDGWLWTFFAVWILFSFCDGGEDHSELENRVHQLETKLADVSRTQEEALRLQTERRIRTAFDLLSDGDPELLRRALGDIDDSVRRFPEDFAPGARQAIANHIRGQIERGGSARDDDLHLALQTLLALEGSHVRGEGAGSRTEPETGYEVDFSNLDLRGFDFSDSTLVGYNFESADLRGVAMTISSCSECNFSNADLQHASLGWTTFSDSSLAGANLNMAYIAEASFLGSDLTDSLLSVADLHRTKFSDVDLSTVLMLSLEDLEEACISSTVELGGYLPWFPGVPDYCPPQFKIE